MNVLQRKILKVKEEKRKRRERLDFLSREMHRLIEIEHNVQEKIEAVMGIAFT